MAAPLDRPTLFALAALLEVAAASSKGPIAPTLALRALLAMLHARSDGDERPFREFWSKVREPDQPGPQPGYVRATNARTIWCGIARSLGLEPQSMELHNLLAELIAQQREAVDPEHRARRVVKRGLASAKYDREIVATKGHPYSNAARQLMADRIAQGEEPA